MGVQHEGGIVSSISHHAALIATTGVQLPITSGLRLWLDASQLGVPNATPITSWPDASGNAVSTTVIGAPESQTSAVNGKPGVAFSGASNRLRIDMSVGSDVAGTLLVVARSTVSGTATLNVGFAGNTPSPDDSWLTYLDGKIYDCNLVGVRASTTVSGGLTQTNPYVYVAAADATSRVVRFRGSVVISDSEPFRNPVGTVGYQTLGASNVNITDNRVQQIIAEVIYYGRLLDSAEIATMEAYLTTKWSLTP